MYGRMTNELKKTWKEAVMARLAKTMEDPRRPVRTVKVVVNI
jgi:hypothetical protein